MRHWQLVHAPGRQQHGSRDFSKAQSIFERIHKWESNPDMSMLSYERMAEALYARGDYRRALGQMVEALSLYVRTHGKLHLKTAQAYHSVANIQSDEHSNYHDQTLENHRRALVIREELLGKNHTDTARSHHLIGTTLTRKGELDAAIEQQQKALAILYDNVRGSNVSLAAQSYEGVALSLIMRYYHFVGALENYRKALKLHTTVYRNRGHLDTSRAYEGVGYSLGAKDDVEGALKNHRMSLRIRLKLVGKNHHLTAASYYEIALLLERKGGKAAAFQNYQNMLLARESLCWRIKASCFPTATTTWVSFFMGREITMVPLISINRQ